MKIKNCAIMMLFVAGLAAPLALTSTADARGHNGYGYGNRYENVSPEQRQAAAGIVSEYDARLAPMQEQLRAKHLELNALAGTPNAKPEVISKLSTEIAALQTKLNAEYQSRNMKLAEATGQQGYGNWGRGGYGACGYGSGMGGYGHDRGGHRGGRGMGGGHWNGNGHGNNNCGLANCPW